MKSELDKTQIYARRSLTFIPHNSNRQEIYGRDVRKITPVGIVVMIAGRTRAIIPWHQVDEFWYDNADEEMKRQEDSL